MHICINVFKCHWVYLDSSKNHCQDPVLTSMAGKHIKEAYLYSRAKHKQAEVEYRHNTSGKYITKKKKEVEKHGSFANKIPIEEKYKREREIAKIQALNFLHLDVWSFISRVLPEARPQGLCLSQRNCLSSQLIR